MLRNLSFCKQGDWKPPSSPFQSGFLIWNLVTFFLSGFNRIASARGTTTLPRILPHHVVCSNTLNSCGIHPPGKTGNAPKPYGHFRTEQPPQGLKCLRSLTALEINPAHNRSANFLYS